jgi:luciferase family oxidoreductase group 1
LLKLSVLDQSPISYGSSPTEALKNTVELAQHVERLGYHRFWVAEHHNSEGLAGSSPEILISHIAAKTSKIRVGSGGVMLPHYSAYKVAENFRLLESLYPNRIDLGLGRAPGGMPIATMALQEGKVKDVDRYPEQLDDLIGYVHDSLDSEHRFKGLTATPVPETTPEIWLLGSSGGSAKIAAEKGASYTFAQFINGQSGVEYIQDYRRNFKPSIVSSLPKVSVALYVVCAETQEEAERIASSLDLTKLSIQLGMRLSRIPSVEQVEQYTLNPYHHEIIKENRQQMIVVGDPKQVKERLLQMAELYETDEFIIVTITHEFEHKLNSYRLLAGAFNL